METRSCNRSAAEKLTRPGTSRRSGGMGTAAGERNEQRNPIPRRPCAERSEQTRSQFHVHRTRSHGIRSRGVQADQPCMCIHLFGPVFSTLPACQITCQRRRRISCAFLFLYSVFFWIWTQGGGYGHRDGGVLLLSCVMIKLSIDDIAFHSMAALGSLIWLVGAVCMHPHNSFFI
jgi:hypothetical protein